MGLKWGMASAAVLCLAVIGSANRKVAFQFQRKGLSVLSIRFPDSRLARMAVHVFANTTPPGFGDDCFRPCSFSA